jgi:hypothetical protein
MDDAIKELQSKVLAKPLLISQEQKLMEQKSLEITIAEEF